MQLPVIAIAGTAACGSDDKPQPVAPTYTAPPPTYTAPPPTATATATAPAPSSSAPQGGGVTGTATPMDPTLASAAATPLQVFANTEAPGMTRDGPAAAGTFQEGQFLEAPFTFQPGKCYTLVAGGAGPTSIEVEMQYTTPIPGIAPSIGTSKQSGTQVSMGGKQNCLKPLSPIAAPAKFILRVKKGAGVAVAQLYSK